MKKTTISSLKNQHQSGTDSEFLTKKELQTEAIGAPLMEHQLKKNPSKLSSNLEVTQEENPRSRCLDPSQSVHPRRRIQACSPCSTHPCIHQQTTHPTSLAGWSNGTDCNHNHPHLRQFGGQNLGNWYIQRRNILECQRNPPIVIPLTTQWRKWRWR